jgi:hypothetical protein
MASLFGPILAWRRPSRQNAARKPRMPPDDAELTSGTIKAERFCLLLRMLPDFPYYFLVPGRGGEKP